MVDFSEIRIGTTMQQLESFVNNQANLSEQAKGSIFNFINDENKYGIIKADGQVALEVKYENIKPETLSAIGASALSITASKFI